MTEKTANHVVETTAAVNGDSDSLEKPVFGRQVDDALRFAMNTEDVTWTPEEERRVLRKIDLIILPMLFIGASVGYADNQAFGYAAIFGLVVDMKLYALKVVNGAIAISLSKYSFAAAIPQLGAVAGQYPLLATAQYFSYGKFLAMTELYSGALALLTIVCKNDASILALRFFYGFCSIVQPLAIIYTAMWWKTNEQPFRIGCYIAGSASGNLIGQAVDIGAVSIVNGEYAASPWKWIYVILGSTSLAYGVFALFALPSSPMKAWFLTEREKAIAVHRLAENNTGIQTRALKRKQLWEAILDPQLYLLCVHSFAFAFVNSAMGSFGAFLVTSFGYGKKRTIVLSMPISAIAISCMLLSGILGTRFPRHRIYVAMAFIAPSIIGSCILWKADRANVHALLGGLYIFATFYGALIQALSLLSANIAGHTKKTFVNASLVVVTSLGGFAGPWAYHQEEAAEGYPTGQIASLSLLAASLASFALLRVYYHIQNQRKATMRQERPQLATDVSLSFADVTDRENPIFQYVT